MARNGPQWPAMARTPLGAPADEPRLAGRSWRLCARVQVQQRAPELAAKLCEDVLPNCAVASTSFDFSRGPRMITDVCALLAVTTPLGDTTLVVQRQLEQLAGPLIHLSAARGVPVCEGRRRTFVRMWLADSSGLHAGRAATWLSSEAHPEMHGARPAGWIGPALAPTLPAPPHHSTDARGAEGGPLLCAWHSVRRLGSPHWESDTVLHVEIVDEVSWHSDRLSQMDPIWDPTRPQPAP